MQNYSVNTFWSDEDEAFIAVSPEFPGLSAFGDTRDEAIAEMQITLRLAVETYQEKGWPLPEPRIYKAGTSSGKFGVRIPKSLHATLVSQAEAQGVSLNSLVTAYLSHMAGMNSALSTMEARLDRHLADWAEKVDKLAIDFAQVKSAIRPGLRSREALPSESSYVGALVGPLQSRRSDQILATVGRAWDDMIQAPDVDVNWPPNFLAVQGPSESQIFDPHSQDLLKQLRSARPKPSQAERTVRNADLLGIFRVDEADR